MIFVNLQCGNRFMYSTMLSQFLYFAYFNICDVVFVISIYPLLPLR